MLGCDVYDHEGTRALLRGVNTVCVSEYDGPNGEILPEIHQGGANSVRIVWQTQTRLPEMVGTCGPG